MANIETSARFAEVLVSPDYRDALNGAFEQDPEKYQEQQFAAEQIILNGLQLRLGLQERIWETRRQAALVEVTQTDLGPFSDFIHGVHSKGGEATPSSLEMADLGRGTQDVVETNHLVTGLNTIVDEPTEFLSGALDAVDARKERSRYYTGPENYATALKFFANKYRDTLPQDRPGQEAITTLVERAMDGFITVASRDKPNFVEMTNLYGAINYLPAGTFDKKFTQDIIKLSLEQLPTYNDLAVQQLFAAMGKMDLSGSGTSAATLLDLALRNGKEFETTRDMHFALRAVANLPANPAANRAFATFLEVRNNLEEPLDLLGISNMNEKLRYIIENVVDDPMLSIESKAIAEECTVRALKLSNKALQSGTLSAGQLKDLRALVAQIRSNYNAI